MDATLSQSVTNIVDILSDASSTVETKVLTDMKLNAISPWVVDKIVVFVSLDPVKTKRTSYMSSFRKNPIDYLVGVTGSNAKELADKPLK